MNSQFYLKKLEKSKELQEFLKGNPKAFLCSGFFVIDNEGKDNQVHFDYYVPDKRELFSFQLEGEIKKARVDILDDKWIPEKVSNYNFEFEDVEELIVEKMKEEKLKNKLQKILLSLQKIKPEGESESKNYLIGTVFISGLGMIKVHIDLKEMKIVLFEKKSVFDMVKRVK